MPPYFTDSMRPAIYRVPIGPTGAIGPPQAIALDPAAIDFVAGAFNLNGIDATPSGRTLITVNSTALCSRSTPRGDVTRIDVAGGPVTAGDGILPGRTLYIVRNRSMSWPWSIVARLRRAARSSMSSSATRTYRPRSRGSAARFNTPVPSAGRHAPPPTSG